MERPAVSLPRFITGYYGPRSSASRAFQLLVRGIGEAKSKHEEERIIREEFLVLKQKISQPSSPKQMREFLVRLIYCEMLGIDASDLHIHAINFAQQQNMMDKRIGYLALSLFLHENHPLLVLLVNTLQRDLKSTNVLVIMSALTAFCKLINTEMVPAVLQQVLSLLDFKRDIVRKKAVMALHRLHQKCPSMVSNIEEHALKALHDRDFGVFSSSLHIFYDLIFENPMKFKHLVQDFVNLQQKVISGKLDKQFEYHNIPGPWIQIKLLKIFALLGTDDQKVSSQMYDVINKTISSLSTGALIGYAIAYECCRTITLIYPNKQLITKAGKAVGLFLVAKSNDIKYLGITALAALVQVNASLATEAAFQLIIIDCLDDPDEMLKRKTLDLLCRITNATNVETVCDKFLQHLRHTNDAHFRSELVARVTELAERYAPDNSWYILTMNEVLELGGDLVRPDVAYNLMRLIAEGHDDEELDDELRRFAVLSYLDLLEKPALPDILIHVICWVLGEYSYIVSEPNTVLEQLHSLLDGKLKDSKTKRWVVSAMGKLVAQIGRIPDSVAGALAKCRADGDVDLRQRVYEIQQLSCDPNLMAKVFPVDASCEDLAVDSSLSFLDEFVANALSQGATPYQPRYQREKVQQSKEKERESEPLKYTPYDPPVRPFQPATPPVTTPLIRDPQPQAAAPVTSKRNVIPSKIIEPSTKTKSPQPKGPWGPGGYAKRPAGSGDSWSRSDSSSNSSGSDPARVRTKGEASTSLLVYTHDDARKQQLASDLFKGVGDKDSSSKQTRNTRGGGHGGGGRRGRRVPTEKPIWKPSDPGDPPPLPTRPGVSRSQSQGSHEVDLLLNFETSDDSLAGMDRGAMVDVEIPSLVNTDESRLNTKDIDNIEINRGLVNNEHDNRNENSPRLDTESSCSLSQEDVADQLPDECKGGTLDTPSLSRTPENKPSEPSLLDTEMSDRLQTLTVSAASASSGTIPDSLREFPHTRDAQELCCDSNLRVTVHKVYKPHELILLLCLTNQGQSKVTDIVSILEPPSNLHAVLESKAENRICDAVLETLDSVSHTITLNFKSPALHMNFGGKITYRDSTNTSRNLFFSHVIPISDFLRPLVLTTEEFAVKWGQSAFERRQTITCSVSSSGEFLRRTESDLRLHPVSSTGDNVIASGTVLNASKCLLHAALSSSGSLEIWIKTNSQLLSEVVMKQCIAIMQR
ncbi:AP-4 complex subunit epsilon-1 isoform X2 [Nematostella vectensis]|nr:AP-4 complex subunit epsilon-1 isoform X2 [Nematostella vectensis]